MPLLLKPLTARDPQEGHRVSTPLELFFDLVFVVAIAFAGSALHHDVSANHFGHALLSYMLVFFAIWWAWVNFSWFASAYDSGDALYNLAVFVQLTGALVLAAGVPQAFDDRKFGVVTAGYVIMRLALVGQWLRVRVGDPATRGTATRFALAITLVQIGWICAALFLDAGYIWLFFPLAIIELLIPIWAESAGQTPWHPEHITERYGLFTIIVLGESVLAASLAIQSIGDLSDITSDIGLIIAGGLLTIFAMWWLSFGFPAHDGIESRRSAVIWSYGHYVIWWAAAAVGVGLSVAVDDATGEAAIGQLAAGLSLAIPVAVYVAGLWFFHDLPGNASTARAWQMPAAALLILLTPVTGHAALVTGVILVILVIVKTARPSS